MRTRTAIVDRTPPPPAAVMSIVAITITGTGITGSGVRTRAQT